jgi:hypothetical protein
MAASGLGIGRLVGAAALLLLAACDDPYDSATGADAAPAQVLARNASDPDADTLAYDDWWRSPCQGASSRSRRSELVGD